MLSKPTRVWLKHHLAPCSVSTFGWRLRRKSAIIGAIRAIAAAQAQLAALTREARDLAAKEIEDAVYDLKAANPHRKPDVDERTPKGLMAIIESKGREIAEALARLRGQRTIK